jgi:hypothetical protein
MYNLYPSNAIDHHCIDNHHPNFTLNQCKIIKKPNFDVALCYLQTQHGKFNYQRNNYQRQKIKIKQKLKSNIEIHASTPASKYEILNSSIQFNANKVENFQITTEKVIEDPSELVKKQIKS